MNTHTANQEATAMSNNTTNQKANVMNSRTINQEVSDMGNNNVITDALREAIKTSRYPGPWVNWSADQPMDQFLLGLMEQPAQPDSTPYGRLVWRSPIRDALGAMPYIYRSAVHQLMAQYFHSLLMGNTGEDPVYLSRVMHDNLSTTRSLLAARLRSNHDEFAEATSPVEVAHQHSWQQDASEVKADAKGSTVWASCSLEQAMDDFASAAAERTMNWATSLVVQIASTRMGDVDYRGWDKVALDRIPVAVEEEKVTTNSEGLKVREMVKTNKRQKTKTQLDTPKQRFWAHNRMYRMLVKELWSLESLLGYWEYRAERAASTPNRPLQEAYAGGEDEQLQIGRIDHYLSHENADERGDRAGGPEHEVVRLIEGELESLGDLLQELEAQQRSLSTIWKLIGQSGAPFWYDRTGACYTVDEKHEAMVAREAARAEWMRTRDVQVMKAMTQEELALLAELTKFDTSRAE